MARKKPAPGEKPPQTINFAAAKKVKLRTWTERETGAGFEREGGATLSVGRG